MPYEALRDRIEDLPGIVGVGLSDRALNIFMTEHVAFKNSGVEDAFKAVEAYRNTVAGDVFLTWRIYPENRGAGLYLRLSFNSVRDVVARFSEEAANV